MRRLDYERLLRQSRAAFEDGDAKEGLRLLDLAASFERDLPSSRTEAPSRS